MDDELTLEDIAYLEGRSEVRPCGHPAWYEDDDEDDEED